MVEKKLLSSIDTKREQHHVASFSGGKDSTAMVLHLIETGAKLDEVIHCDTYKEFPAMYRHIEKVKEVIQEAGIQFTELKSEKSFDYLMFGHEYPFGFPYFSITALFLFTSWSNIK